MPVPQAGFSCRGTESGNTWEGKFQNHLGVGERQKAHRPAGQVVTELRVSWGEVYVARGRAEGKLGVSVFAQVDS